MGFFVCPFSSIFNEQSPRKAFVHVKTSEKMKIICNDLCSIIYCTLTRRILPSDSVEISSVQYVKATQSENDIALRFSFSDFI